MRELGPAEVLKLTCCSASNTWLKQACSRSATWPAAFPAVYECLGDLAIDSDDMVFTGWRMERLFPLHDKKGAIAARSATIHARMRDDPSDAARPVAPETAALEALTAVCELCSIDPEEHPAVDASAALLLAGACDGALREGFLALRAFIQANGVKLDVANPSNVMMDCFGRLRLADPLTMRLNEPSGPPPAPRHWVAARLPQAQRGFNVTAQWLAVPFGSKQAAETVARETKQPGVPTMVCDEAKAASLIARKPEILRAFEFGASLSDLLSGEASAQLLTKATLR